MWSENRVQHKARQHTHTAQKHLETLEECLDRFVSRSLGSLHMVRSSLRFTDLDRSCASWKLSVWSRKPSSTAGVSRSGSSHFVGANHLSHHIPCTLPPRSRCQGALRPTSLSVTRANSLGMCLLLLSSRPWQEVLFNIHQRPCPCGVHARYSVRDHIRVRHQFAGSDADALPSCGSFTRCARDPLSPLSRLLSQIVTNSVDRYTCRTPHFHVHSHCTVQTTCALGSSLSRGPKIGHSSTRHVSLCASQYTEHQHKFSLTFLSCVTYCRLLL